MTKLPTTEQAIDHVIMPFSEEKVMLADLPCLRCAAMGCAFLALTVAGGFWHYCSDTCRREGLTIGGWPVSPVGMEMSGMYFVDAIPLP